MNHFVLTALSLVFLSFVVVTPADAQCTGNNNPTITGGNNASVGSLPWANANDIAATDGQYATVSALVSLSTILQTTTQYLTATHLGFNIPPTATICGVTVTINRQTFAILTIGGNSTTDNSIKLINSSGTITGTDHAATGTPWPTTLVPALYGSSSDTWGQVLTPAVVNSPNFGVAISATLTAQAASIIFNAQIDQVIVTVYANTTSTLPLHIESFTAVATTGGNQLNWTASADEAGDRIVAQRSTDQSTWENLTTVDAGEQQQDYSYLDASPLLGNNYYRLEEINSSGSIVYSPIALVEGETPANIRIYPNPTTDMINIASPQPFTRLVLRDVQGRTITVREYTGGGVNSAQIPVSNLPGGLYFLQVDGSTYKVVKN